MKKELQDRIAETLTLYYTTLMEITLINWMRNNCL